MLQITKTKYQLLSKFLLRGLGVYFIIRILLASAAMFVHLSLVNTAMKVETSDAKMLAMLRGLLTDSDSSLNSFKTYTMLFLAYFLVEAIIALYKEYHKIKWKRSQS